MAARSAAKVMKSDEVLRSIETGKHADLLVLAGRKGEPYERLPASS